MVLKDQLAQRVLTERLEQQGLLEQRGLQEQQEQQALTPQA
jgi:hypothetical protein